MKRGCIVVAVSLVLICGGLVVYLACNWTEIVRWGTRQVVSRSELSAAEQDEAVRLYAGLVEGASQGRVSKTELREITRTFQGLCMQPKPAALQLRVWIERMRALERTSGEALPVPPPVPPQVLVYGRGHDAVKLDPAAITDGESALVCVNLYDTLVRYREGSTEVEPCLATSWDVSPDGLIWTFVLRPDAKFHDGTPVDAVAVAWNFQRQLDPEAHGQTGPFIYWRDMFKDVTSVGVTGVAAHCVRFHLARPYAPFLANLAMFSAGIVSPTAMRGRGAERFAREPVGSGPFRFASWKPGESIVLEAYAEHWEGRPRLDRLIFKPVPDNTVRLQLIKKGSLDAMDGLDAVNLPEVEGDPGLVLLREPGMNVAYLAMHNQKPPFDDARVRRAVALALDKERIATHLYHGTATAAVHPLPPTLWGYHADLKPRPVDRKRAEALIKETGLKTPLPVELYVMDNARPYMPDPKTMALHIQSALAPIGLEVKILEWDWPTYLEKTQAGAHQMCLLGWIGDNGDPDNFLYVLLDKSGAVAGSASNVSFYTGEKLHEVLVAAQAEADQAKRAALYRQAQEIIHDEVPMIPLVHNAQIVVARNRVRGLKLHPTGNTHFARVSIE